MDEREKSALKLFRDALDLTPAERDDFVRRHCGSDEALRRRVDSLLQGCVDDEAIDDQDAVIESAASDALIGQRLGAFRVVERVGRGGMGVVYRGEREGADFSQEVALKLIRRGFDFDDVQARFLRERRILSALSHPGIARFVDGGVTDDGRPWFALEFVHGHTLSRWCDAHRLDVHARVRLFLDVCAAVQYAHTQLVVHRDLKPGNILVDDDGHVHLLDFGVAGLLEGETDEGSPPNTIATRHAMTPGYAAPEQLAGRRAGVAADVYALGVTLYELVAGVRPHEASRQASSTHDEADVPLMPLSQAITRDSADAGEAGQRLAARTLSLVLYRQQVRGDLNRIVETALAAEPERRYPTVQAFADDLDRWLRGVPVTVSGNRLGYRIGKFVRRNRVAVAIAAIAMVAVVAGVAGTLWQAQRALESASRANTIRSYLVDLFEANVPGAAADRIPDTRTLLERGAERARNELRDQPELQADMLGTLGRIDVQLGLYDQAEPLLLDALELRRSLGQAADPESADVLLDLARIERQRQRIAEAKARLHEALAIVAGADAARESEVRQSLGVVLALDDHLDEGVAEMHHALALRAQVEHPPGARAAQILNDLGFILERGRRYEDALAADRESLALSRRLHAGPHADVAGTLSNIGECLRKLGRLDEAETALREAVAIDARVYDAPHPRHAVHLGNLAAVLVARGKLAEAEQLMREALHMREALYGSSDPQSAKSMINLGAVLLREHKLDEGIATYRRAAAIFEGDSGDWRNELAYIYQNLARGLSDRHEWAPAEAAARHALELRLALDGEDSREAVQARAALGSVLLDAGHAGEARKEFERVLAASLAFVPPNQPRLAGHYADLARAEAALGDDGAAREHFEHSLQVAAQALNDSNPEVIATRLDYAATLRRLREAALGEEQVRHAHEGASALSVNDPLRLRADAEFAQHR